MLLVDCGTGCKHLDDLKPKQVEYLCKILAFFGRRQLVERAMAEGDSCSEEWKGTGCQQQGRVDSCEVLAPAMHHFE